MRRVGRQRDRRRHLIVQRAALRRSSVVVCRDRKRHRFLRGALTAEHAHGSEPRQTRVGIGPLARIREPIAAQSFERARARPAGAHVDARQQVAAHEDLVTEDGQRQRLGRSESVYESDLVLPAVDRRRMTVVSKARQRDLDALPGVEILGQRVVSELDLDAATDADRAQQPQAGGAERRRTREGVNTPGAIVGLPGVAHLPNGQRERARVRAPRAPAALLLQLDRLPKERQIRACPRYRKHPRRGQRAPVCESANALHVGQRDVPAQPRGPHPMRAVGDLQWKLQPGACRREGEGNGSGEGAGRVERAAGEPGVECTTGIVGTGRCELAEGGRRDGREQRDENPERSHAKPPTPSGTLENALAPRQDVDGRACAQCARLRARLQGERSSLAASVSAAVVRQSPTCSCAQPVHRQTAPV